MMRYAFSSAPPFVRRDYTRELLDNLRAATIEEIPAAIAGAQGAARFATMTHEAGLHWRGSVVWYDQYVPIVVATLLPYQSGDRILPPAQRVQLNAADYAAVQRLRSQFAPTPAGEPPAKAFRDNSQPLSHDFVSIIAGRIGMYYDIIKDSSNVAKLPASLALGITSTVLGTLELGMPADASPMVRAAVSCPLFLIGATTTSLGAPLGIGVIGLIGTLQSYANCMENLSHLRAPLKKSATAQSRARQMIDGLRPKPPADRFHFDGDRYELYQGEACVDRGTVMDFEKKDFTVERENVCKWAVEETERRADGHPIRCFQYEYREVDPNGDWREGAGCKCELNLDTGETQILP